LYKKNFLTIWNNILKYSLEKQIDLLLNTLVVPIFGNELLIILSLVAKKCDRPRVQYLILILNDNEEHRKCGIFLDLVCCLYIKSVSDFVYKFFGTIYDLSFVLEMHTFLSKICIFL